MSRRRRCEHCAEAYTQARPERRYCSRACAHAARPRAARVAAGRTGGRISGERKRRQAEQRRTVACYDCTHNLGARCAVHRVIPPAGTCRDGVPVAPPRLPLVYDEGLSRGPRACHCGRRITGRCDAQTATACPFGGGR